MANSVELHRALALNDSDDTQLFTFLLSIGDVENFRKNPARSALFYYQGQEWYLTCGGFDGKDGIPQLGVFLYWTGTNTAGLRCRSDYRIIVRNIQDPAESLISEGLQVLFNPPKSLGWGKRELGPLPEILSVSKGFLVEPNGSIIVELALKSGKTIFEQTVDISGIIEEPKQADNPFKSYFSPNFSLAGFEFYLSVYPFGDREKADGHVSMYLHRYLKTGNPNLGCRIRYRFFIGGHLSPGDSKTFEFSFENDHGYGKFKAFQPLSSTDVLRRGPVPVGVEILSITSYAQLELPLTTRGYYHTDNFVFEDVIFGDHRGNQWKLSVNNTSQVLCFRLDAENKNKLTLESNGKKEERCTKYLQSQVLVQSRANKKNTVSPVGGSSTAYFSASLPDKCYATSMPIAISKAKALDGEYCTKEEPSLSVRVELLNIQDLPGVMKDYPVLEFERFRLYHTREGLRKCLEQNEEMSQEIDKLKQQLSLTSTIHNNHDLAYHKPIDHGALHVDTTSSITNANQSPSFPSLSPVSKTPSYTSAAYTANATVSSAILPPSSMLSVSSSATSSAIPRARSPTMRTYSPTPSAESSGPSQFVMLPGDDDPAADNSAPKSAPSKIPSRPSASSGQGNTGSTAMRPKANIAQSYVGIVSGPARLPVTPSESNAPRSQIKLQPGFDLKPKTPIAQSYVGIVTPTTRASEPTTSMPSITSIPHIRVQPGMDVKPKAAVAQSYVGIVSAPVHAANPNPVAQSYVGIVSAPVSAADPNFHHAYAEPTFNEQSTFASTTKDESSFASSITHSYHTDSDSSENRHVQRSEPYAHDYNYSHQRYSYAEALTSGDTMDSIDFGIPQSSEHEGSVQSWSSNEFDIVSGDTAPRTRTYAPDPHVRTAEPHVRTAEPNVRTAEPHVRTAEPHVRMGDPHVRMADPRVRTAEPVETHVRPAPVSNHTSHRGNERVQEIIRDHAVHHNPKQSLQVSRNPNIPPSHTHQFEQPNLQRSHSNSSQKSVQFATELTKEYRVNTKKPVSKSKTPVTSNEALPTKPILSSPKYPTTTPSFSMETKPSHNVPTEASSRHSNQKPNLANKAWAKPTIFSQMSTAIQAKGSPVFDRKPPQVQISKPQAQVLTTGRAPAQQAELQDHNSNTRRGQNTLPPNWTPGFQNQGSDSSNPSAENLHLYTMPDLDLPPALPPRNGDNGKHPSRILTSSGTDPTSRMSSRSASSLPRASAFGAPLSHRTLSNQALTGHLRGSPTPSIDTHVSTRRDKETTFGTVAETAQTSRQLPQAQVAHTARKVNADGSHVGSIETHL